MTKKNISITIIAVIIIIIVLTLIFAHVKTAMAPEAGNTSSTSMATTSASSTASSTEGITVNSGKFYSNTSFSFYYPNFWTIAQNSPLLITNFNGKYGSNGTLPSGGVTLAVVTTTVDGNLQSIMDTELMGAKNVTTTILMVDNVSCPAAAFQSAYAPGFSSKDVSVYCQQGTELWKIYLSYDASDTVANSPLPGFNSMLASMKLL